MSASPAKTGLATRVVLFDLDGTLSDSAPGILVALRQAFAANGLPPLDVEVERALLGPPFYQSLPPLIGTVALKDVIGSYRRRYAGEGARSAMYDAAPYPGVAGVLAQLHAAGVALAVATSKPEQYAIPIVEHLGLAAFFTTVGGDELDGSLPTKALVIDKVLGRLGRPDPADVIMVGDRSHDIEGAREHGIGAVGVEWGYASPGELAAAHPVAICATPFDLGRVLGLTEGDVTGGAGAQAS
ncbi:MAG: HAD hydrolase-like protein [Actinomycetota bacterium]|nr:HAD hydrolase-like protein [Actinomycetota bacterium]